MAKPCNKQPTNQCLLTVLLSLAHLYICTDKTPASGLNAKAVILLLKSLQSQVDEYITAEEA